MPSSLTCCHRVDRGGKKEREAKTWTSSEFELFLFLQEACWKLEANIFRKFARGFCLHESIIVFVHCMLWKIEAKQNRSCNVFRGVASKRMLA